MAYALEHGDKKTCKAIAESLRQRAGFQHGDAEFVAFGFLFLKDAEHPCGEHRVMTGEIELEIQSQAARIPVCGADAGPGIIDEQDLGVIKGRRGLVNAAARFQQFRVQCVRRPGNERDVVPGRREDAHLDTAGGAKFERPEFSAIGSGLAQLIEASE